MGYSRIQNPPSTNPIHTAWIWLISNVREKNEYRINVWLQWLEKRDHPQPDKNSSLCETKYYKGTKQKNLQSDVHFVALCRTWI